MKRNYLWIPGIVISILLLGLVQQLLMPKYMSQSQEGAILSEYYNHTGNHDVIFIGDCEVYENISPVTLWEEYGISSWIRGSAQQMIWQSYYLMEETFRYETPKAIVFNVLSMQYGTPASSGRPQQQEAYNRMTLDGMRWSSSKWKSIQASMTDLEKEKGGMWLYLFPLLRYHDRWSDLTAEDFQYLFHPRQISHNGYLMQTDIRPVGDPHVDMPLADYQFSQVSYTYLDKMVRLCEEHGTQLILMKAPSLSPTWWEPWDEQIQRYAKEHELVYINFLDVQDEIGIDWTTDTYDTGLHLNVYGAEKLSRYFGRYLSQELNFPDHRGVPEYDALWSENARIYHSAKALQQQSNK